MKIALIAATNYFDAGNDFPDSVRDTAFYNREQKADTLTVSGADLLGEFAGRACYQAWDMPNPKTATNAGYLANIIAQGHFSVLEHSSATFYVEGVSRSLTHELVRHRHLSYSELSQRYVDIDDAHLIVPPAVREWGISAGHIEAQDAQHPTVPLGQSSPDIVADYVEIFRTLTDAGLPRKRAREAARSVLPNATETKIVVTGNFRAWRDMLGKRWHVAADAEIREFAGKILEELRSIAPNSFQDIPTEPYGSAA